MEFPQIQKKIKTYRNFFTIQKTSEAHFHGHDGSGAADASTAVNQGVLGIPHESEESQHAHTGFRSAKVGPIDPSMSEFWSDY